MLVTNRFGGNSMMHRNVWAGHILLERFTLRGLCLAFAFLVFTIVPADFGTGAAELKAHHFPKQCGRQGQRPCNFWEHMPSCVEGMIEKNKKCLPGNGIGDQLKATGGAIVDGTTNAAKKTGEAVGSFVNPNSNPNCGGLGQKGCGTSCDTGLAFHFTKLTCVQSQKTLIKMAKNLGREVGPVLEAMGRTVIDCGAETIVKGLKARDSAQAKAAAQRLIERNCVTVLLEEAQRAGYNTVTIGYGGAAALIIGGEAEAGIAYDVGFEYFPSSYGVIGIDVGTQVEASPASVVISVYKGNNQPGPNGFGGDAHGVTWGGKLAVGGGMALWWNYDGSFAGASVAIGSGIEAEFAYVRNTTAIYSPLEVAWNNAQQAKPPRPTYGAAPIPVSRPSYPGYAPSPARQPTTTELALGAAQTVADAIADAQQAEFERRQRETWFKICNKAKVDGKKVKKLNWALAYWAEGTRGGAEGWLSNGWWTLKKGKCQMHNLPNGPDGLGMNYTVMIFGNIGSDVLKDGPRHYSGDGLMFCIRGGTKLRAADQAPCDGENERLVQGIPFEVGPGGGRFEFRSAGKEGLGYVDPDLYSTGG